MLISAPKITHGLRRSAIALLATTAMSSFLVAGAQDAVAETLPVPVSQLDRSGNTIPKTNYAIPAGAIFLAPNGVDTNPGTQAAPVKSINRAVTLAPDNGTVVMRQGQFRDWYHDPKNPQKWGIISKALTFQAFPGESPWFNGADIVPASAWTQVEGTTTWSMPWSTPQFCDGQYYLRPMRQQSTSPNNGPCSHADMAGDASNPLAGDPQMLFSDATPLRQVSARTQLDSKTFYYDWDARRLYIGAAPTGRTIEAAVRPIALVGANKVEGYKFLGVGFHRYASNQYHNMTQAALYTGGAKVLIENSTFAYNAAGSTALGNPKAGTMVRGSIFSYNGYTALWGSGNPLGTPTNFVVDSNVFYRNNYDKFGANCTISCGQAAVKLHHIVGLTVSNNLVQETYGEAHGLWCDLNCIDSKFVNNVVKDNAGAGIFYEVSSRGIIAGNVISGSKFGLAVASPTTKVYNNTLVDNIQGIKVYDDQRTYGVDGWTVIGPDTRDVEVVNNVVFGKNYSLMALGQYINPVAPNTAAEDLFSKVDNNVFLQTNGTSPIYVWWRARNGAESIYRTSAAFYSARGLEGSSRWMTGSADQLFVDKAAGDYRIRSGSVAAGAGTDIPADVASALGSSPTGDVSALPTGSFSAVR